MELKMHVGNMEYVDRFAEGIGFQVWEFNRFEQDLISAQT